MSAVAVAPEQYVPSTATGSRIEFHSVSRWYGNVVAVNDVSCTLGPGITALLGPNGAGKSTILHMMAGLLVPSAGELLVNGERPAGNPEIYRMLGLVPEREAVHPFLSGWEFVHMSARLHGLPDANSATQRAIELVDLMGAKGRKVSTYSKGMRQRIKIAGALVHQPSVLLLDEPFNGMDPRQRLDMIDLLRRLGDEGCLIVISSHILEELHDFASNVLVMVAGRLAASGHFREIRRLMTDRPHTFTLRSSDDRALARGMLGNAAVFGVELTDAGIIVRTADRGVMTAHVARIAKEAGVRLLEIRPADESLESVFSYLVDR